MISVLLAVTIAQASLADAPGAPATDRLNQAGSALLGQANTSLRSYPVTGSNIRSVYSSMEANYFPDHYGKRVGALTSWQYSYEFGYGENGACDPAKTKITYAVVVTLPDLETRDALPERDRAVWGRTFQHVIAHEADHIRIVEEGVPTMEAAMRGAPTCDAAIPAGAAASNSVTARSVEFDRVTNHGQI